MTSDEKNDVHTAINRTARHEFFIIETYEAGLELLGSEVKSIRMGGVNLKEGYCHVVKNQLFLEGVHISPYEHASSLTDPVRSRRLLLHRREIDRLASEVQTKGLTIVPLKMYFKDGRVKIEIGLAKGKKAHDKRDSIKKREAQREIDRAKVRK